MRHPLIAAVLYALAAQTAFAQSILDFDGMGKTQAQAIHAVREAAVAPAVINSYGPPWAEDGFPSCQQTSSLWRCHDRVQYARNTTDFWYPYAASASSEEAACDAAKQHAQLPGVLNAFGPVRDFDRCLCGEPAHGLHFCTVNAIFTRR